MTVSLIVSINRWKKKYPLINERVSMVKVPNATKGRVQANPIKNTVDIRDAANASALILKFIINRFIVRTSC